MYTLIVYTGYGSGLRFPPVFYSFTPAYNIMIELKLEERLQRPFTTQEQPLQYNASNYDEKVL